MPDQTGQQSSPSRPIRFALQVNPGLDEIDRIGPQAERAGFDVVTVSGGGPHVESLNAKGIDHVEAPSLSRCIDPRGDVACIGELRTLSQQFGFQLSQGQDDR